MDELAILKRKLEREKHARKQAESILEEKALQLHQLNEELELKIIERTKELRISEEKYRGIIENMELGLLEVDNNHKIIKPYSWFCDMTGYTEEELIGKNAVDFLLTDPNDLTKVNAQQNKRERGQAGVYEVRMKHKNGSDIWVMISGSPIVDINGKVTGSLGIHYDISSQKKLELDLIEAKRIAESAQEAEKQFLAKMSHEIRTPLNAIIGMSYLLTDTNPTREQTEYLTTLRHSSDILKLLISDILDFSKIQAGEIDIRISEFNLRHLVENLHKTTEIRMENRLVKVICKFDEAIQHKILGDQLLLNQILINLMSNATKFTKRGEIGLAVKLLEEDSKYYKIQFQVYDTGIGIPKDQLHLIFEDFKQLDQEGRRKYGGTGLGLSITKQLVELHGGEIIVESKPNEKTSFTFAIKYEKSGKIEQSKIEEIFIPKDINFKHAKILIAEDNYMNQKYISILLNKWDLKHEFAQDGQDAIEMAAAEAYDLIFMDISMPRKNGYEATTAIRQTKNPNQTTPVIALSALAFVDNKADAIKAGMTDFLGKPFGPKELLDILCKYMPVNTIEHKEPTVQAEIYPEPLDAKHLHSLYGEDYDYALDMFDTFLTHSVPEFKAIKNILQTKDYTKMASAVHKLKPNFEMVGLLQLRALMQTLEDKCRTEENSEVVSHLFQQIDIDLDKVIPVLLQTKQKLTAIVLKHLPTLLNEKK